MRAPKGFGKNYFTLAAIQATVSQITILSQTTRVEQTLHVSYNSEKDLEEEPHQELLLSPLIINSKASHCSCHCSRYSRQIIKTQATSNCNVAQFLRTDSVSSPPFSPSHITILKQSNKKQGKQ